MKKGQILLVLLMFVTFISDAQQAANSWPGSFFSGYKRSLTSGKFSYHSPQPDVNRSLLLRSIDSVSFIAWETEQIPANFNEPSANFIWMFGIDANPESHKYRLYLNDHYCLTFANPLISEKKSWIVSGKDGVTLTFRTTMLDKYDDPMGYAVFTIPRPLLIPGKSQQIRVVGESAGSNVWYMTFESPVEEKLDIVQEEAIIQEKGKEYFSVLFNFVHLGESQNGKIMVVNAPSREISLEPGFNQFKLLLPAGELTTSCNALISIGRNASINKRFEVRPVRHWVIYLVQHAHTDIGYTRPQTEILPEHMRYIDYALDYCDQTDSLPDNARFRWTCETSWAVREYIRTRPQAQLERLKQRVKEGRIEVTGLFLNSSDLSDETSIAASLQPVKEFRDAGLPVHAAMQDDINGVPWCLADYLKGCGINFLTMGQNASRALKPFDRPTSFLWESLSGSRIIVNRPEHYMWGNQLGILTNAETFGKALFFHLKQIQDKGYPFDHYAIQFSGYLTDNSPPSTTACLLVKQWNEKYVWPKLRLAVISEFGDYLNSNHLQDLPIYHGAWPDWWMDGFGSAALETAYTRASHEDYTANLGLMSMGMIMGIPIPQKLFRDVDDIGDGLCFYDEHTFGAAESISDPMLENSVVQWNEKAAYAWDVVKKNHILREDLLGLLQWKLPKANVPSITVINTLNWNRSGEATVFIDHQVIPDNRKFKILDEAGKEVLVQLLSNREEGTYWTLFVTDVPPLGYKTYRIILSDELTRFAQKKKFSGWMENQFYSLRIDTVKGAITSLFDKQLGKELAADDQPYGMGEFIYEQLGKNREQLDQLKLDEFRRSTWKDITVSGMNEGTVWSSITLKGQSPECAGKEGITCEIRIYNTEKKVEFRYSMIKLPVTDAEGVYVAFPFRMANSTMRYEVQGGTVIPGKDQLEGSASDWNGIQNFVSVNDNHSQIVFVSHEIPLVQLGDINLGKFSPVAHPVHPSIYSWVLNNYWTTNFRAYQEGELKWRYFITSDADTSVSFSTRFGWGERMPFITRVFPAQKDAPPLLLKEQFSGKFKDLLLVCAKPLSDGTSVILHLREIKGIEQVIPVNDLASVYLTVSGKVFRSVSEVNVLGEKLKEANSPIVFKPFETKFIKLEF
ncbi:MAG: hypothetical protein NTX61_09730 [Bacteroidetes bacterium]|nr:hypothetical protein [Bacteroidota bacterium]